MWRNSDCEIRIADFWTLVTQENSRTKQSEIVHPKFYIKKLRKFAGNKFNDIEE